MTQAALMVENTTCTPGLHAVKVGIVVHVGLMVCVAADVELQ